ncbi:MAG TPA: thioesterase family protein, partial [Thermoplasmata archaeon]
SRGLRLPLLGTTDPHALDIIIAEATCRYLAPVRFGQEILGEVAPSSRLGTSSFSLLYRFRDPSDESTVYARGRTVVVCYDYARNSKKPIPVDRRLALERDGIDPVEEGWG